MPNLDQLEAFVAAYEQGSFSGAARQLGRAQSAISTAIANLELDTNLTLFDRSTRKPTPTPAAKALLSYAINTLHTHREFVAHASSLDKKVEARICIAIEQNISYAGLIPIFTDFEQTFPFVQLQLLDSSSHDIAELIRNNKADIGLMFEQEVYPQGFNFRGCGYSKLLPVCRKDHPLVKQQPITLQHLRSHRQLITCDQDLIDLTHERYSISAKKWLIESPYIVLEVLNAGIGWAYLHEAVVHEQLDKGDLIKLDIQFIENDTLQGLDIVWANNRSFGKAGEWLLNKLLDLY